MLGLGGPGGPSFERPRYKIVDFRSVQKPCIKNLRVRGKQLVHGVQGSLLKRRRMDGDTLLNYKGRSIALIGPSKGSRPGLPGWMLLKFGFVLVLVSVWFRSGFCDLQGRRNPFETKTTPT